MSYSESSARILLIFAGEMSDCSVFEYIVNRMTALADFR